MRMNACVRSELNELQPIVLKALVRQGLPGAYANASAERSLRTNLVAICVFYKCLSDTSPFMTQHLDSRIEIGSNIGAFR